MEEVEHIQQIKIGRYFKLSVLGKGAISLAEVLGGIALFFVPLSVITGFVLQVTAGELALEPNNFLALHLQQLVQHLPLVSGLFVALYLLSRGLVKLLLIIALLKNQLWAYPSSLAVLGAFVLFQLYEIILHHSWLIVALTVFDLMVMYFIWREYQIVRGRVREGKE